MPPLDIAALAQLQSRKVEFDRAAADLAQARAEIAGLDEERRRASATGQASHLVRVEREIGAARRRYGQLAEASRKAGDRWRNDLDLLVVDPCDAGAATPLLLLPVRVETRFASDGSPTLRVRIYPDTVHMDGLRRTLTPEEQKAGDAYWRLQPTNPDAAWTALTEAVGRRAAWVADNLRPGVAAPFARPEPERGMVARLLPDRFVVEVIQNKKVTRVTGKALGPDPLLGLFGDDDDEERLVPLNGVPVAPGAEWIVDFASAEAAGLAVTVKLADRSPVERVMVFGTRQSRSEAQTAAELAALFEAHRYAGDLAFVPVGTPTNNLDDQRSGYVPAWPRPRKTEPEPRPQTAEPERGDGARLANALGLSPSVFAGVPGADLRGDDAAQAANVAFWAPTWGTVLDLVNTEAKDIDQTASDKQVEQTRRFHANHVRGRGPLPSFRIGKQPYGVLPVSIAEQLQFREGAEQGIKRIVLGAREQWRGALAQVPRLGAGDVRATMLELLGSSPVSVGLRARTALASHAFGPELEATKEEQLEQVLNNLLFQQMANASLTWPIGSLATKAHPIPLPYAHDSDPAALKTLASGGTVGELKSVLQALAAVAAVKARANSALSPARLLDPIAAELRDVTTPPGIVRPTASALSQAQRQGSRAVLDLADRARDPAYARSSIYAYQPEASGRTSFAAMSRASLNDEARHEYNPQALAEIVLAAGQEQELKEKLLRLAEDDLTVRDRALLVAETLDTASHRLDAWVTGLVDARRSTLRSEKPEGLQVGAFGWVEDVRPATAKDEKELGFIHAPSVAHAATAGVLRAGYLAHAREEDGGGFAIDLSSRRARLAMDLLAARREGQTLGQALGYRIERMMQDERLGQFLMGMRARYPGKQGQLTDAGGGLDPKIQATIASATLLDGLRFVEEVKAKGVDFVAAEIEKRPADDKYLEGVTWQALGARKDSFVRIATWARQALDAAADLMMAEAVHQLTLGNTARAAAAMDAVKGEGAAPEPSVLGAPAPVAALTHRLMIVMGHGAGWPVPRQRAWAALELEAWAAARLGPPDQIIVGMGQTGKIVTLAEALICALDFVWDVADRDALFGRLRTKLGLPADATVPTEPQPGWPASSRSLGEAIELADTLRRTLSEARPALPADLAPPFSASLRQADISAAYQRLSKARDSLGGWVLALQKPGISPAELADVYERLGDYGIRAPAGLSDGDTLLLITAEGKRRLVDTGAALDAVPQTIDTVARAGEALFGAGFPTLIPLVTGGGGEDAWSTAVASTVALATRAQLRRWISDLGSIRPAIGRHLDTMMLSECFGWAADLSAAQFLAPEAGLAARWAGDGWPGDAVANCVFERSGAVEPGQPLVALVIDEFVEPLTDRGERTSGIAFNAPAPGARPPQTLLLAVAPDDKRWTTDRVSAVLGETIELAKLRGVTLERQLGTPRLLPAIYAQSRSLQGEPVLHLEGLVGTVVPAGMWFVKDQV